MTLDCAHPLMGAVALGLAEAGFDMVLQAREASQSVRETARRIRDTGRKAVVLEGTPGDPSVMHRSVHQVHSQFRRLDVLVTRGMGDGREVGHAPGSAPDNVNGDYRWTDTPTREEVAAALRSPFFAIQGAVPLLAANGGAVVNIVDRDGGATSNEGLVYLTRLMAQELRPRVRVNAVTVGAVDGQGRPTVPEDGPTPRLADYRAWAPDLTRSVLFLLGAPYVNGEVLRVGETAAR